jgi:hypothetical protein
VISYDISFPTHMGPLQLGEAAVRVTTVSLSSDELAVYVGAVEEDADAEAFANSLRPNATLRCGGAGRVATSFAQL